MSNRTESPIRLFVLGTGWGLPFETSAPFPLKLATWMRMAGIDFEFVEENNTGKGPKGKSPWIEYDDVRMGDSSLIIEHLAERRGLDLDAHLDAGQRAIGIAVQRMLEEHFHQCFEHQLFFGRGGEARVARFREMVGFPLHLIVIPMVLGAFRKQLHARGVARHTEDVIIGQGIADLDALAELIGTKPYLLGDRPTSFDACVFGFLGVAAYVEGDNPLFRHVADHPVLMPYCERMRRQFFPETLERLPLQVDLDAAAIRSGAA